MLLFRGEESSPQSLAKAISGRALGGIDTFLLSLFSTHDVKAARAIASKIALYFGYERLWAQFGGGRSPHERESRSATQTGGIVP